MKVFIWKEVKKVSDRYHSQGGLVVFAKDENRARQLANSQEYIEIQKSEKVNEVRDASGDEAVFIFPDAGCC
jgi:predicted nucleic acid-binding protein